jgi:peptidoglycan/LPS O-acetylase OafA/YrhL
LSATSYLNHPQPAACRSLGLDLLRAIAIMMVLVSHWTCHMGDWFGIAVPPVADVVGDIGVEIFFALSGFLIGRILIEITRVRPTWRDFQVFMVRRCMRTLPLYFLWLAMLLCVFPPKDDAVVTALRFITLTQNLVADLPSDYYFAVTWSLTIEEWFYLLFGAGLILLSRRIGGKWALPCCLAVFLLAPLALRLAYLERGPLVFFRIDEIGYGVLMARLFLDRNWMFRHPWVPLAFGIALIAASMLSLLPVPAALAVPLSSNAEVIGGALCLPAALRLHRAAAWFERPVRWIATRSYALYLFHLTILVDVVERLLVLPNVLPASAGVVLAIVVPFPLAALSYHYLETPLLRRRPAQDREIRPRQSPLPRSVVAAG